MDYLLVFFLIAVLGFLMIVVHEAGHYLAGVAAGIPARDMKLVLLRFPQHVAVRDGEKWVSPVSDMERYISVTRNHLRSRKAAFLWVAGGMVSELAFTGAFWRVAVWLGYPAVAFWAACVSLSMYAVNVGLMDLPLAVRYRHVAGDTSGLWHIAPVSAIFFSALMVGCRVLLIKALA